MVERRALGLRGLRVDTEAGGRGKWLVRLEYQPTETLKLVCIDLADNSRPMAEFIQGAPAKSLLFMATHDDGSSR